MVPSLLVWTLTSFWRRKRNVNGRRNAVPRKMLVRSSSDSVRRAHMVWLISLKARRRSTHAGTDPALARRGTDRERGGLEMNADCEVVVAVARLWMNVEVGIKRMTNTAKLSESENAKWTDDVGRPIAHETCLQVAGTTRLFVIRV
jgi:hypothetical protein